MKSTFVRWSTRIMPGALAGALLATSHVSMAETTATVDVWFRNARIVDGTGAPWLRGDVTVRDGRISEVGRVSEATSATRVVDLRERYLTPGFIDVHTHCEGDFARQPDALNFIRMGVTTVITGNCGSSVLSVNDMMSSLTARGVGINVATLLGHGSVRRAVMGNSSRDPVTTEIQKMQEITDRAMREGAVGLSTGLIYTPGTYSKTAEIVALAKAISKYGGVYATHMRNEGLTIENAIQEALTIGREANVPVQISHFKVTAPKRWGATTTTIALVEAARKAGQDVAVDQYVYTASSTGVNTMLPDWANEGTGLEREARLANPTTRSLIRADIIKNYRDVSGRKDIGHAQVANFSADKSINGLRIPEIAKRWHGKTTWEAQADTVLDIVTSGGASMVFFSISEDDVQRIAQYPFTMFASDSGVRNFGSGVPHPRGYGNNARVLQRYVKELGLLRLEEAVRKMTSLPAQRFRFWDRGIVRPGMAADLVAFDLNNVRENTTFEKPHAYASGMDFVMVNGVFVIDDGTTTGQMSGRGLRGGGLTGK